MELNCDDSFSYGESRGEKNYFAIRKVYEVTFDGITWYKAGDAVYYGNCKKRMLESVILRVEYDGSVLVENEMGIFSCSVNEMKSGHIALGKVSDCDHDGVLGVRYKDQFTIDLVNWFTVEQRCIIKTTEETLIDASIEGIMPNGDIHISCHGMEKTIHYSSIKYIKDFYDNTQYLVMAKRSGRKSSAVVVKKNIRAMMREYY